MNEPAARPPGGTAHSDLEPVRGQGAAQIGAVVFLRFSNAARRGVPGHLANSTTTAVLYAIISSMVSVT